MMKNSIRKNARQTVAGFALLSGIIMAGVNPASADTLKDSNGNSVEYNKSYYLEPKEHPGKGITHGSWNLGQWAYLESNTQGLPIQIKFGPNGQRHVSENLSIGIQMQTTNLPYSYLRVNRNYNGIQLTDFKLQTGEWKAQNSLNSNSITFKNDFTNKYLNHQGLNGWLDATKTEQTADTQWKLVPQN